MRQVGPLQDSLAVLEKRGALASMAVSGGEQGKPVMVMLVVVPGKGFLALLPGIGQAAKACRIRWMLLGCLELRFRVEVVVRDVSSGVSFGHAQVSHEQRD